MRVCCRFLSPVQSAVTTISLRNWSEVRVRQYFICVHLDHLADCHAYKFGGNASASVLGASGEHSDIASHGSAAVRLQLAYNHTNKIIFLVEGLQSGHQMLAS